MTDRVPAYGNQLGFDIDRFDASGILLNADATIAMRAAGDSFRAGVVTFATDVSAASLKATRSVADANGGVVRPGDRLDYTIDVTSAKTEAAVASALIDQIPPYSHYVDGSLQIAGVPVTHAVDLDTGQLADGQVTAYLGTGASATTAGSWRLARLRRSPSR